VDDLREEMQQWLSNETWRWTTYATLTFARPMRKDALRFSRAWVRFIARTATKVWGFCFQETHSDGQRLHVHCLLSVQVNLLNEPSNREMWSWWFQKFGRCQIVTVSERKKLAKSHTRALSSMHRRYLDLENHQKVVSEFVTPLASYLTKYMVKEALSSTFDWDFYAFANGFELTSDEFHRYSGVNPTFITGD